MRLGAVGCSLTRSGGGGAGATGVGVGGEGAQGGEVAQSVEAGDEQSGVDGAGDIGAGVDDGDHGQVEYLGHVPRRQAALRFGDQDDPVHLPGKIGRAHV